MKFFRKNVHERSWELKTNQLDAIDEIYRYIAVQLQLINKSVQDKKIIDAIIPLQKMLRRLDLLEKLIDTQITLDVKPIFDKNQTFSSSKEDVENKTKKVREWINSTKKVAMKFQTASRNPKTTYDELTRAYFELHDMIVLNEHLMTDYHNTILFLFTQKTALEISKPPNYLEKLFDEQKFHKLIVKSSKNLFINKHYANSISDAYKTLANYVKKKSGQKNKTEFNVMTEVFNFDFDQKNLKITRYPIIEFNSLETKSLQNEQEGLKFMFMGSMKWIRNTHAHEFILHDDPHMTLKYLSLASLLASKLDKAKSNNFKKN